MVTSVIYFYNVHIIFGKCIYKYTKITCLGDNIHGILEFILSDLLKFKSVNHFCKLIFHPEILLNCIIIVVALYIIVICSINNHAICN